MTPERSWWAFVRSVMDALVTNGDLDATFPGIPLDRAQTGKDKARGVAFTPLGNLESTGGEPGRLADVGPVAFEVAYVIEPYTYEPAGESLGRDRWAGDDADPGLFDVAGLIRDTVDYNLKSLGVCRWWWAETTYDGEQYPRVAARLELHIAGQTPQAKREAAGYPPPTLPPLPTAVLFTTGAAPLNLPMNGDGTANPVAGDYAGGDLWIHNTPSGVRLYYKRPDNGSLIQLTFGGA